MKTFGKPSLPSLFVYLVVLLLLLKTVYCSAQDMVAFGIPVFMPASTPAIDKPAFGLEMAVLKKKKDFYYIGMNVDFGMATSSKRPVDIPNNLQTGETMHNEFGIMGVHVVNRFDLTPQSKAKIYIDANLGLRLAKFSTIHEGWLLMIKTEDEVYKKISGGMSGELFLNYLTPFKNSRYGIQLKTGIVAGSAIQYMDDTREQSSNAVFWVTSIGFLIRYR